MKNIYTILMFLFTYDSIMSNQIALTIDSKLKSAFTKQLKKEGMTSKSFFVQCVKAFNEGKLRLGLMTQSDTDLDYYNHPGFVQVNEPASEVLAWMKKHAPKKK